MELKAVDIGLHGGLLSRHWSDLINKMALCLPVISLEFKNCSGLIFLLTQIISEIKYQICDIKI